MVSKKIIIIAIIILIVAASIFFVILNTVNYERIEITPNGTSIEVPANQTKYVGAVDGVKIWNWDKGIMVTYNSNDDANIIGVTDLAFSTLNELIKNGQKQDIDGFTCYVINADELLQIHLFDLIKVNYGDKFYCISLSNETTHDNIIILCNDKDMVVHMAESLKYKNVFSDKNNLDSAVSKVENITGDLHSKVNSYVNSTDLNSVKSSIENKVGDLLP